VGAIPIIAVVLLAAAAIWRFAPMWNGRGFSTAPVRADFSLRLQRAGSDYRVTWDAGAPVVVAAKRAALFIKDGSFEKELKLDREQLNSAGLVYSPATSDVSFRLELYGASPEPAIATVRLLAASRPEVAAEAPATTDDAPVTSAPQEEQRPAEPAATVDKPVSEAPVSEAPAGDAPATIAAATAPAASDGPAR